VVLVGILDLVLTLDGVCRALVGMTLFITLGIHMVVLVGDTILGTLMEGWDGATTLGTHTAALDGDITLGETIGVGEVVGTTIVGGMTLYQIDLLCAQ
jgi:hypothetical protein